MCLARFHRRCELGQIITCWVFDPIRRLSDDGSSTWPTIRNKLYLKGCLALAGGLDSVKYIGMDKLIGAVKANVLEVE